MLANQKKSLRQITEWLDKTADDVNSWNFEKDIVRLPGLSAAFQVWQLWRLAGHWPLGNWLERPLSLLAKVDAIDVVYHTWREFRHDDKEPEPERPRGMASMNRTQLEIVRNLDRDD